MTNTKPTWEEQYDGFMKDEYGNIIINHLALKHFIQNVEKIAKQEAYERGYKVGISSEGGILIGEPFRETETVSLTPEQSKIINDNFKDLI